MFPLYPIIIFSLSRQSHNQSKSSKKRQSDGRKEPVLRKKEGRRRSSQNRPTLGNTMEGNVGDEVNEEFLTRTPSLSAVLANRAVFGPRRSKIGGDRPTTPSTPSSSSLAPTMSGSRAFSSPFIASP